MIPDRSLAFLSALELRESALLNWGATSSEWSADELRSLAATHDLTAEDLQELLDMALIVETPTGGFRSRAAETVRLLASLRQSFPSRRVTDGRRLVLDYRYLHRPRRRPCRSEDRESVLAEDLVGRPAAVTATAAVLLPERISGFQRRSLNEILSALESQDQRAVMVSAGTGSGKTLAFYLPVLAHTAQTRQSGPRGTTVLAVYPRNELLKDQLRTLLWYVMRLAAERPDLPILRVGTWFGPTPFDAYRSEEPPKTWRKRSIDGKTAYVCPFVSCPDPNCGGELLWSRDDMTTGIHQLVCLDCSRVIDDTHINLTRKQSTSNPPDVMLTTTESLNRQLAAPTNLAAFGIAPSTLQVVLLDEVHVYQGVSGAQNAYLFRRLSDALDVPPTWVALSATLANPESFLSQVVSLPVERIRLVTPELHEMEEAGAEYLLALRHDPTSGAGTLSTTIQTIMALGRSLDPLVDDPFDPPVDSRGIIGQKLFAFTDKLDVTNRLFWDLNDAEGWAWPGQVKSGQSVLTLAHLRSDSQDRLPASLREPSTARDLDGQWWWLPEHLGHAISSDRQLIVDRTSSQDRGVSEKAQVVVATSTLEVGYDDSRIGAVVQHKAPHNAASFLQRKGRAGRDQITRPWTVVVLSDWGRDRDAWRAYDWLFSPQLPATRLPLDNRYIQRIQAVYSLMDWISREVRQYRFGGSVWSDLTAPANVLSSAPRAVQRTQERQDQVAGLLRSLLGPGPSVTRLRRHLIRALSLPAGEQGDLIVDEIFWDGPRPLLLVVVPTMLRRLASGWEGEVPDKASDDVKHRVPARGFVPGNLFGDLAATDVLFTGPGLEDAEAPYLPVLRALRDFMPGTVSRHFGVRAKNKRHWVPVPGHEGLAVDETSSYRGSFQCSVTSDVGDLPVFAPTQIELEAVPGEVRDFSRVDPVWETRLEGLGAGRHVPLPSAMRRLIGQLTVHTHADGDGVRVVRFARRATGAVFAPDRRGVEVSFGTSTGVPAALGQELLADGLLVRVIVPDAPAITAAERSEWLAWLIGHDSNLDEIADRFARQTLAEAALVVRAERLQAGPEGALALDDHLARAAFALGRVRGDDQHGALDEDRLALVDADWLRDTTVLTCVEASLQAVESVERTGEWEEWWRRRYALSVAGAFLEAASSLTDGIDTDELSVDAVAADSDAVWITETGPGGLGTVDAVVRATRDHSSVLAFAVDNVVAATELEEMDQELVSILRSDDPDVAIAMQTVRDAWSCGHAAAEESIEGFVSTVRSIPLPMSPASQMALTSRVLSPGGTSDLRTALVRWIALRDELRAAGVDLGTTALAAVAAGEARWDLALHLDQPTRAARARRIANLLWPWGAEASDRSQGSRFGEQPLTNLADVRAHVDVSPPTFEVSEWDDHSRSQVAAALATDATVRLRFGVHGSVARMAILDLQVRPIEAETLLLHPRVVGLRRTAAGVDVWLNLPEVQP